MSLYRYGKDSTIQEIAIRKSAGGGVRSFLYLADGAEPQVKGIKTALKQEGWNCVPNEVGGRFCLEVRGPRKIDQLEEVLHAGHFTPATHASVVNDDAKISFKDKFKSNMLFAYGIITGTADLGILGYGLLKQKLHPEKKPWEDVAAAIAYSAGSLTFFGFGHGDKSDHQLRDIANKIHERLESQGVEMPQKGSVTTYMAPHKSAFHTTKQFMHKHSAAFGNGFTALAGAFIAKGAFKSNDLTTRNVDSMLGASTFVGGMTAALVKEKAPDPSEKKHKGFFGNIASWIQERPNRVAGIGYGISTIFHGSEVIGNLRSASKDFAGDPAKVKLAHQAYGLRGVFVGMNLVAEMILALASKGQGSGVKSDKSIDDTAYAIAANAINHQPPAVRERLFADLSKNFLSRYDVLGGDPTEIETALRARVQKLSDNPWVTRTSPKSVEDNSPAQESTYWRGQTSVKTPATTMAHAL